MKKCRIPSLHSAIINSRIYTFWTSILADSKHSNCARTA